MLDKILAALIALTPASSAPQQTEWSFTGEPTLILSAVREIECDEGGGTGWMITGDILVTAAHVSELTNCKDQLTQQPLKEYKRDLNEDLALMTGKLPRIGEYIKYSCAGYTAGLDYEVYGWSSLGYSQPILRQNVVSATASFSDKDDKYRDGTPMPIMRIFNGYTVPGMSGGPYTRNGVAYGIVSAGVGMMTLVGYAVTPTILSTDLKDTILCEH